MAVIAFPSVADALAAVVQSYENEMALADPATIQRQSILTWMRAVTAHLEAGSAQSIDVPTSSVVSSPASDEKNSLAQLQAENAALTAKVAAGEQAIAAFDAVLHPADAAPSSSEPVVAPTIAPSNAGV